MFPQSKEFLITENLRPFMKGGISFDSIYYGFYLIRLLRYLRPQDFKRLAQIYPQFHFEKIFTLPKMRLLVGVGYLQEVRRGVFAAKDSCLSRLNQRGFLTRFLPAFPDGEGRENAMANIDQFIRCLTLPNYYTLLFPNFGYIEPDGLLVERFPDGKFKLSFLEIQKDVSDYKLEDKKKNYERLAKDIKVYEYWKEVAQILGHTVPTLKDFKFNIKFICSTTRDWGEGFIFVNNIGKS